MDRHIELSISEELDREISRESIHRATSWSVLATELLDEALRMRRAPGVGFADGPAGRRAVLAGTGLDVWEIVASWQAAAHDFYQLRQNYPWLSEPQLRAALAYYEAYPDEIDARLAQEARWTPERVAGEMPSDRQIARALFNESSQAMASSCPREGSRRTVEAHSSGSKKTI